MRTTALFALLASATVVLSGCSVPQERREAVSAAASQFAAREAADDLRGACALLAPATREELVHTSGPTCVQGLAEADLPRAGEVRTTDVYGRQARVELDGDTYFLTSFPDGWHVNAAGCTPRRDKPYRCLVKGD